MNNMDIWKYASAEQYKDMLLSFALLSGPDWPPKRIMACLYALSNHPEAHYHALSVPKKSGGVRRLLAPDPLMKQVQRNLLHHVLEGFSPSEAAMAYRRGVSAKDHAARHCGQRVVLTLDIQDFFDSITFPQVLARCFPIIYFPRPVGVLLASLCCAYERLPQGAPTSPAVSNLVMKPFDEHMLAWCGERNITYSRYCDDMTFSGDFKPASVIGKTTGFLETMGMELNREKTVISSQAGRQTVTGITVNQVCQLPRDTRRKLRQEVHRVLRYGTGETDPVQSVRCLERLLGRVSYLLQVRPDDAWFQERRKELRKLLKQERG